MGLQTHRVYSSRPSSRRLSHSPPHRAAAVADAGFLLSPDAVDLDRELGYWRSQYRHLTARGGLRFGDYEPAVKLGLDAYMRGHSRALADIEDELRVCYARVRGVARLDWDEARDVVSAACERVRAHRRAQ